VPRYLEIAALHGSEGGRAGATPRGPGRADQTAVRIAAGRAPRGHFVRLRCLRRSLAAPGQAPHGGQVLLA
jgi:hypothetical protein